MLCFSQVRSHAQKYFLKLEKSGKASVVPPPRPKKRAAKPYPVQVGHLSCIPVRMLQVAYLPYQSTLHVFLSFTACATKAFQPCGIGGLMRHVWSCPQWLTLPCSSAQSRAAPATESCKLGSTQDRSEDTKRREARSDDARRKSRRVQRQASPAASDDASAPSTSQPANTGCAITSASPSARSSMRSAGTAAAAPGGSAGGSVALRPVRTTRSARAGLASPKGSSADLLEGEGPHKGQVLHRRHACASGASGTRGRYRLRASGVQPGSRSGVWYSMRSAAALLVFCFGVVKWCVLLRCVS